MINPASRLTRDPVNSTRKDYRVVWRKVSNQHDREIFYCTADNEDHAWELCRDYVAREYQVRKPVFIEAREL